MFDIKDKRVDLEAPANDLQMVENMLRSLQTQKCFDEVRRKVLFSSNMAKYMPELARGLILTAAARNKDWEGNAFGNHLSRQI